MAETKDQLAEDLETTPLDCFCTLANHWGKTVQVKSFQHEFAKRKQGLEDIELKDGEVSKPFKVYSQSGTPWPWWDYWSLKFAVGSKRYKLSGGFRCNISKEDNGKTIRATIRGSDSKLEIEMPKSSGCKKGIVKS